MPSIKRKGKCGGPANFQKNAVRMPSNASEPSTKLTTGSRIARKRNSGNRMHCHRSHSARLERSPALVRSPSLKVLELAELLLDHPPCRRLFGVPFFCLTARHREAPREASPTSQAPPASH